ncbi:MAG TPA: thioredoxin family protein [Acidimicrobiia bacterium]|nr:thioredoxin family protein [Acidimicrobiia bacterium]
MRRVAASLIAIAFLGACAPGEENLAIIANAPTSLGTGVEQRLMVGLVDPNTGESLAAPEVAAAVTLTGPNEETVELPTEFLWTIENVRGLYVAHYTFPEPGMWSVRLHPDGLGSTPSTPFQVELETVVPEVGDPAPRVASRTSTDYEISEISTDLTPDPSFYELSLDEALSNGQPTVVVFATPKFCESQTCGPLLDQVQALSGEHPDVNFLHVEIYENLDAASFDELELVEAVSTWGLPSEPWVFVIDREGAVSARFEGAASDEELSAAMDAVAP